MKGCMDRAQGRQMLYKHGMYMLLHIFLLKFNTLGTLYSEFSLTFIRLSSKFSNFFSSIIANDHFHNLAF